MENAEIENADIENDEAVGPQHHPPPPGWNVGAAADPVSTELTLRPYIPEELYSRISTVGGGEPTIICSKITVESDLRRRLCITGERDRNRLYAFLEPEEIAVMEHPGQGLAIDAFDRRQEAGVRVDGQYSLRLTLRDGQGLCIRNSWVRAVRNHGPISGQVFEMWGFRRGPHSQFPPAFVFMFRAA